MILSSVYKHYIQKRSSLIKDTDKFPSSNLLRHLGLSSTSYSKHKQVHIKDTHRENTPSVKTEVLTKSMITYVPAIGTLVPVH